MQKNKLFPLTLIAIAVFSGCSSVPHNESLTEAHSNYKSARSNVQVMNLASAELLKASEYLDKADNALSNRESESNVTQLANMAKLQVGIAHETVQRKTYNQAVTDVNAKLDKTRLEASTAEADAAKQQVSIVQQTSNQQAVALAVANANAERDQVRIAAKTVEADAAKQELAVLEDTAYQQADALAAASAKAESDEAIIAMQQVQLKGLNAQKTSRGLVMTLGDVLFSTNNARLSVDGMHSMELLAEFLNRYPQLKVLVEGYTDNSGSNDLNQDLSDRRAFSVRTALTKLGIKEDRISTRGYGEAFPVSGNDTDASRQLNRRVEIILSDANGMIVAR